MASNVRMLAAAAVACLLSPAMAAERDGSHDFDFNDGAWKTHIRRPAAGGGWTELEGTVVSRKLWGGRAQVEEIEADGKTGRFEGLTLFLYDPQARQWSQVFASSRSGVLATPTIGEFTGGRGEFYGHEPIDGRAALVRGVWSDIRPDSHRFEQSVSRDGGRTWQPNFIAALERLAQPPAAAGGDHPKDFDFEMGTWEARFHRLKKPLAGSTEWVDQDGKVVVRPLWNGRANLAEVTGDGPLGRTEFLALRLYNPDSRQWSISFAASRAGTIDPPLHGDFSSGHGEFYGADTFAGRAILVRLLLFPGGDTWRSEQAFSADGGKTWETNWVTTYRRAAAA